jgi:hypothetical protein
VARKEVGRFVVPASAGSWYLFYKLPPEGGTTNINSDVANLRGSLQVHLCADALSNRSRVCEASRHEILNRQAA